MNFKQLMQDLGYVFKDEALLTLALTHRSVGAINNERLEFLGDSILNFIIAIELYRRFELASEGQLTRMRAHFICEDMLVTIARECSLGKYLILGAGEARTGAHQRSSILADCLEAIIGAMYLDTGHDLLLLQSVVLNWYQDKFIVFNDKKLQNKKDPKTLLQELLQARKLPLPEYTIIKIEGEPHEQIFHVECKVVLLDQTIIGIGNSRRKAEQMAAEQVLNTLQIK